MATETLRPNGVGDETNHSPFPGTGEDNYEDVDEAVEDGATTQVRQNGTPWVRDLYETEDSSGSNTIYGITVYAVCWYTLTGDVSDQTALKIAIKSGTGAGAPDTVAEGDEENLPKNAPARIEFSYEWTTNPATAAAWTWDEIDALQIGVAMREPNSGGTGRSRCTQVYCIVSYLVEHSKALSDSLTFADAQVKVFDKQPTDTLNMADSFDRTADFVRPLSDTFNIADTIRKAMTKPIAEVALAIADSISTVVGKVVALADSLGISDSIIKAPGKILTDSISFTDALIKTPGKIFSETVNIADVSIKTFTKGLSDTFNIADTFAHVVTFVRALSDTLGITDAVTVGLVYIRNFSDAMGITDSLTVGLVKIKALADTMLISDSLAGVHRVKTWLRMSVSRMSINRLGVSRMGSARLAISRMPLIRYIIRRWTA